MVVERYLIERPMLRATAVVAVAFLLLASGRQIVPEVCATQQSLESCHRPVPVVADGCCDEPSTTAGLHATAPVEHLASGAVHCGLCVLATGVVLPLEYSQHVEPAQTTGPLSGDALASPALPILWSPTLPRDPPAAA